MVLERIRAVTEYIRADVEGFQEDWLMCQREEQEKSIRKDKRRLEKTKKHLADIDKLITHTYEDMILGTLSQERYQKVLEGYQAEQADLNNEIIGWLLGDDPRGNEGQCCIRTDTDYRQ